MMFAKLYVLEMNIINLHLNWQVNVVITANKQIQTEWFAFVNCLENVIR